MPEQEFNLQVGETLRIGDYLVTVVDVENNGVGEVAFQIESGSAGVQLASDDLLSAPRERSRLRALAK
jgi:hypothetical protein